MNDREFKKHPVALRLERERKEAQSANAVKKPPVTAKSQNPKKKLLGVSPPANLLRQVLKYVRQIERVLPIHVGWLLGVVTPVIVEGIRRHWRRRDLKRGGCR